jgi:hypothetical protein
MVPFSLNNNKINKKERLHNIIYKHLKSSFKKKPIEKKLMNNRIENELLKTNVGLSLLLLVLV